MIEAETKTCGICGIEFSCLHKHIVECSCSRIVLSEEAIKYLKTNYSDCLCPQCLTLIGNNFNEGKG